MVAWYAHNSSDLSGKRVARMAAMMEKRSTHCEMSVIGRRAGAGGRPGVFGRLSSVVISDISTKSKSNIFFTSLGGREATGLNGPEERR